MASLEIRRVEGEALLEHYFPLMGYAFNASPQAPDLEGWRQHLKDRDDYVILVGFEDGVAVASVTNIPMTQALRGLVLPMGGVAGVASLPQARRKGYVYALMQQLLHDAMPQAGQPISVLYPFRESFYGRLGYVGLPQIRRAQFKTASLAPLLKQDFGGTIQVQNVQDATDSYLAFLQHIQAGWHGMALYPPQRIHAMMREGKFWLATASFDGQVEGLMIYSISGYEGTFTVRQFLPHSSRAKYQLLQWISRHIDQTLEVDMVLPPTAWLETWLPDLDLRLQSPRSLSEMPSPMGRVVSVLGLQGLEVGPETLHLQVEDALCPWNNGVYRFDGQGGRLQVEAQPSAAPDATLSIEGLSALVYYGADPADFPFRGWGQPSEAVQAQLRRLFPPAAPYLLSYF